MAKLGYYPAPVYVATFEDGAIGRMSFWSQAGKPIDFERGKRLLATAYARPEGESSLEEAFLTLPANPSIGRVKSRVISTGWVCKTYAPRKIVSGYVEFQGKRLVENQVVSLERKTTAAALIAQARKLIAEGKGEAAIALIQAA